MSYALGKFAGDVTALNYDWFLLSLAQSNLQSLLRIPLYLSPTRSQQAMDSFDPYQQWLGIPSQLRPLNHYILLGVRIYEVDPEKINAAYEARMELLKTFQAGPRGELSQKLIAQIAKAKRDLLDSGRKAKYDSALKKQLQSRQRQIDQEHDEPLESGSDSAKQDLPAQPPPSIDEFPEVVQSRQSEVAISKLPASEAQSNSVPYQGDGPTVVGSAGAASAEAEDDTEMLSPIWFLKDFRYVVGLLALSLAIMTATVKLLSPSGNPTSQTLPSSAVKSDQHSVNQSDQIAKSDQSPVSPLAALPRIQQAADGSFEIHIEQGQLEGADLECGPQGISGWAAGDQATWVLDVATRRTGYFNCRITYQAKSECGFEIQLGNRKSRPFTLYPHDEDFEEEFIVRMAKAKKTSTEQAVTLTASQTVDGVQIKRIVLVPNR